MDDVLLRTTRTLQNQTRRKKITALAKNTAQVLTAEAVLTEEAHKVLDALIETNTLALQLLATANSSRISSALADRALAIVEKSLTADLKTIRAIRRG